MWAGRRKVSVDMQTASLPLEAEGMEPCQVSGISFIELPGVCVKGCIESCLVDEMVPGIDWSQDATKTIAWGAGDVVGQQIDSVKHKKLRDVLENYPESLVDRGGVALAVLGPWRPLSKGSMPLDVAHDAPVAFVKELVSKVGRTGPGASSMSRCCTPRGREVSKLWAECM